MAVTAKGLQVATEQAAREASKRLGEPSWLAEDRVAAVKRYLALPLESSPLFTRHTEALRDVNELPAAEAKPTLAGPKVQGVQFEELGGAVRHAEPLKAALLNDLHGFAEDKLSNLPRALFGSGAVLRVPKDKHLDEPFTVTYRPPVGAAFARNLIVLEPGARATFVEEVQGDGAAKGLFGLTTEVSLGDGAELRLLGIEMGGSGHTTIATRGARLGDHARLEMHHAFTGSTLVKGRSDVALAGKGSKVQQTEVVFGSHTQRFDLTSNIRHDAPATTSDALSKAVLKDSSRANIKGVITIPQEGKDSDSFLGQHAMLLSKHARCIAIPSLEIVTREILRAKHAATVAQVDDNQVFYLETRGLSDAEARKAIVLGFLSPLLDRLGEQAAERVRGSIEAKWG